ncbi:MAG: hypothetical protein ONB48_11285 [candidate division KSB1 bacterium]|nr:hypothetical protein [candidate division KSB1 bacterium]MDZ7275462.1 hypothetical protein [candidate division KSB1 bacterium]MDZ7286226.1 hypothetical protein [candidate division KSB1 bacterium]MDZ7296452.1 hypothetical protein [candidate division KSB1 bacterium]MDZ7307248.1 hypothetical protein [candidate division KSB1 bacterium]
MRAQEAYLAINSLGARPLAMGGAFVAVPDELVAGLYNPANFGSRSPRDPAFRLFLNPLTPVWALTRPANFFDHSTSSGARALATAGLLIKGMVLRLGPFDFATIMAEQSGRWALLARTDWGEVDEYLDNQYSVLVARLRVAERVAVGGSLGLYYQSTAPERRAWLVRADYGIAVMPWHNVLVGVSYLTLPTLAGEGYRDYPERFVDGSVNLGISAQPWPGTLLALDVRNLVEDNMEMVREPHVGFEQQLFSLFALRGGMFWMGQEQRLAYSAGCGLLNTAALSLANRRGHSPNWLLNYGVVMETGGRRKVHALTVILRL